MDMTSAVRWTGLLAILGALIYAVGDVLLLAAKVDLADFPRLQPHAKTLSDAEKMVVLPWWRLAWGGLLGVFSTPLLLAGFWQVYQGLAPAGSGAALPPVVLFACASVVGTFVHGTFIYMGEYVQALNRVSDDSQAVLVGMIQRHRKILIITYGFLMACILAASIWYTVVVAGGGTGFPALDGCGEPGDGVDCLDAGEEAPAGAGARSDRRGRLQRGLPDFLYFYHRHVVAGKLDLGKDELVTCEECKPI